MVGGPAHGTCCVSVSGVFHGDGNKTYTDYCLETILTHNPTNHESRHFVAVHRDLLLHRKLPSRSSIMYLANEDALNAYILDALFRAVSR